MNRKLLAYIYFLSAVLIVLSACAKISSPTGGVRDRKPPEVTESLPVNGAINFSGKKIEITFNEFVVLDNISDKFMVSPPMKKKPRVFTRGKSVNVEFDDKLKDSTTYTFYFQDAIKDLNEGNVLENFQFVFSTGSYIDTLSVTGNVYNAIDLEVPEKAQVLLYKEMADSAVAKHIPDYIARVDPDGYFRINNVHEGKYRLYALVDEDNSKNYNTREEEFAFLNWPVEITVEKNYLPIPKDTTSLKKTEVKVPVTTKKSTETTGNKKELVKIPEPVVLNGEYKLFLFKAKRTAHYLTGSSRDARYQLLYTLSLPPDSMKFSISVPGAETSSYFIEESRNRDTIKVWLTDSTLYSKDNISTIVSFPFTDTLGILGYKQDTISMRFTSPRAPRVKVKKPPLRVETNIASGFLRPGEKIVLKTQTPFRKPDTSRLHLYEITDKNRKLLPSKLIKDSLNSCRYFLSAAFLPEKKYLYIADTLAFSNIYNDNSDSTGIKFSLRTPESLGQIGINFSKYNGDMIIQMLDKSEKPVKEAFMKQEGKLVFSQLDPGTYRLRVIYDLNGDRRWTTGDFDLGRQPEPVSYYFQELELKAGRDLDQDWDMRIQNFKEQKLREKRQGK
jgi:hypothetical protein